jgi:hypothetical protein
METTKNVLNVVLLNFTWKEKLWGETYRTEPWQMNRFWQKEIREKALLMEGETWARTQFTKDWWNSLDSSCWAWLQSMGEKGEEQDWRACSGSDERSPECQERT